MLYKIIIVILLFILIFSLFYSYKKINQYKIKLKEKVRLDEKIQFENNRIKEEFNNTNNNLISIKEKIKEKRRELDIESNRLDILKTNIDSSLKQQEELSQEAYSNYMEILDGQYQKAEKEYDDFTENMKNSYSEIQLSLLRNIERIKKELAEISSTRAAAIEAARKEKEIKENPTFYCIQVSDEDKADISKLENIKKTLNKPRVLSMLIWQTFFQKQLKTLSANILGSDDVIGIYKITNIITNECYIGQSVNVRERWAEHCKAGLGIDTPPANKLYQAMQEYGLFNFSFELIESCEREKLNEKERFFIQLYQSDKFGYNSTAGNK